MNANNRAARRKRLGRKSGQATTEYALIVALLFGVLLAPLGPGRGGFMAECIDAYRAYYVSYYYVLNLPFP
jgi:hypothetical protein